MSENSPPGDRSVPDEEFLIQHGVFSFEMDLRGKPCPRPRVVRGRAFMPKKYKEWLGEYSNNIERAVQQQDELTELPIEEDVVVVLFFELDNKIRVDVDNLSKSAFDGMNKLIYKDDSQVVEVHAYKYIGCEENRTSGYVIPYSVWRSLTVEQRDMFLD